MGQISTVNYQATTEAPWIKWSLIGIALSFLALFLVLPLAVVLYGAFEAGLKVWWQAVTDPDALASIRLTLLVLIIVVPTNAIFGVAIAWAIAKFEFRGKTILISIIDMPFAISPVVVGLIFVILFGAQGWFGPWLAAHDLKVIFAVPGIVIVIMFGTLPFIARELIPLMQQQGKDEEEASLTLGASGLKTFWYVTLPNIKWGLLYGVILCNARAMGEFGAVAVVSGRIRGETNTMPLHIEVLYNEYMFTAAFAVSSLFTGLALVTIVLKSVVEWKDERKHQIN
ncbi:sulfate ABC transporter permease subunit CysW [Shewanella putrefaciens]|uniref:Sulfate ABC transporter permease subunit CysW n=1 Tax=Shewanella putrefaciens TaxID=24 RepID=A0ABX8XD47_SHEPU|nr:sulfate ABC transporter permease subunit CysW [Shewanella putrefaciens]AVV83835.1 sulfate/thiosulfate transporter permease subunit [Shewanella putrefaciens]QSE49997.1 sulfate ABC transporter permease subunit CysW [Shewanella putrefaciens]QYX73407.1 sulfate ABC transporter permease subunit CysW [Shewanella putrefaciens]